MRSASVLGLCVVILGGSPLVVSCRTQSDADASLNPSVPDPHELPPLVLKDDTPNLLLTWVDEKGNFKVGQKIADVPAERKDRVRVVVTTQDVGTGSLFYVADLRNKAADGSYPVKTLARSAWDEMGASLRKARIEALSPSAVAARPPAAASSTSQPSVTLYGSETCPACREALRYLKGRGVKVVEKQIDENDGARAELAEKLRRANLPNQGQIPVIDVGGRILIGFSAAALEQALRPNHDTQTL